MRQIMTEGEKMSVSKIQFEKGIKTGSSHNFLINVIHNEWVNLVEEGETNAIVPAKHRALTGEITDDVVASSLSAQLVPDYKWVKILHTLVVDYKTAMCMVVDRIKMCRYTTHRQSGRKFVKSVMFADNVFYLPSLSVAMGYNTKTEHVNQSQELISVVTEPAFYVPQEIGIGLYNVESIALYNPERTIKYALGGVLNKHDYDNFNYQNVEVLPIGEWVLETMSEYVSFDDDPYIKMGNEILKELGIGTIDKTLKK
jgi:hypothetical protein